MIWWIKRIIGVTLAVVLIVATVPVAGLVYGFATTGRIDIVQPGNETDGIPSEEIHARLAAVGGYRRNEESTFLTYPEWAIVYAAREYAAFTRSSLPHAFPYWAYVGRFWQDYALMIRATRGYPFNLQNHLMLVVIGTSHTIENVAQWSYENTAGRLSSVTSMGRPVPQDDFQARAAADYAAFLDQTPWYEFDYAAYRADLWSTPSAPGMAALRSWERKLAFGTAYTIKQIYAALIRYGLSATSDPALLDIHLWVGGPVEQAIAGEPDTEIIDQFGPHGAHLLTRRYQVFTDMIPRLVERGLRFYEIGGNDLIFLTVTSRDEVAVPEGGQLVFDYQLPADPQTRRVGIAADVHRLHEIIPALAAQGTRLEHVYDY